MNCPNCQRERFIDKSSCECGFVFAPGCLMPVLLLSGLHAAAFFLVGISHPIFPGSNILGMVMAVFFVLTTFGMSHRKVLAIYALRTSFLLFVVGHIMLVIQIPENANGRALLSTPLVIFTLMRSMVVIYLLRPEIMQYFKIAKKQSV
jgi:hypothetical protein